MQLIDVLDERIIDLNAEAANKEEVLTLLAGKLKDAGYIADVEAFKRISICARARVRQESVTISPFHTEKVIL